MNKKTVSILFLSVSFCSLFAKTYNWTGLDGVINNPQYYNPNDGLPQLGDYGYFDVNASYTVSFPKDEVYTPPGRIYINAKSNGNTVTFDGRGAEMSSPDLETASYDSEPFKVYAYGGLLFDMEDVWGDAALQRKLSPYKFSDFLFSVSASLVEDSLHFKQGSYHFDYGESLTRKNLFFAYGSGTDKKLSITADGDTSITFAPFLWSVKGRNSLLRFAGGKHVQKGTIENNLTYVNADAEQKPSKAVFEVTGEGTTFDFKSKIIIGDKNFPNRTFSFLVNDGGTLSIYDINTSKPGTHIFNVTNGGTLALRSANLGEYSTGTTKMMVNDSTVKFVPGSTLYLGGTTEETGGFIAGITNSVVDIKSGVYVQYFKDDMIPSSYISLNNSSITSDFNGYLRVCGGELFAEDSILNLGGALYISGGKTYFKNCTGDIYHLIAGETSSRERGDFVIDGGELNFNGAFAVGYDKSGTVSITGGKHVFNSKNLTSDEVTILKVNPQPFTFGEKEGREGELNISGEDTVVTVNVSEGYIGNNGIGAFNMSGGKLILKMSSRNFFMASGAASSAKIRFSGGELSTTSRLQSPRGNLDFLQTGGSINCAQFILSSHKQPDGYTSNKSQVYKITGGSLSCSEWISVTDNPGVDGKLILDGGVVSATVICGGNGSQWNGGDGSSSLSANGGTVKPVKSLTNFICKFDKAEVGPKGLTIDTDYDVTVLQDFTAIQGGNGKIIKKGLGTLTFDCSIAEDITVEVLEGHVVFASENKMKGSVVVANKGVARFSSSQKIASLTLGDDESSGAIAIDNGALLSVAGQVDIIRDGSIGDYVFTKDEETGITSVSENQEEAKTLVINLDTAESNATENISFKAKDTLLLQTGAGAKLTASGKYQRGSLLKQGPGKAVLRDQENNVFNKVTLDEGVLSFSDANIFGFKFVPEPLITQKRGTFEFTGESGILNTDLIIDAPQVKDAVVIKTDGDLTITGSVNVVSGAIIKRGAGKLTIVSPKGKDSKLASGVGCTPKSGVPAGSLIFPEDGSAPQGGYAGFNVVEGEVELVGPGKFEIAQSGMVGADTTQVTETPVLTFKNTEAALDKQSYLFPVGAKCGASSSIQTQQLNVVNSKLSGDTPIAVGWHSDSPSQHVDVLIDNSEIVASYQLWFNHNITTTDGAYYTIRDSGLYANKLLYVYGRVQADFENSILASQANLTPTKLQIGNKYKDFGYLRFSNGSHLYLDQIIPEGVFCIFTLYFNDAV